MAKQSRSCINANLKLLMDKGMRILYLELDRFSENQVIVSIAQFLIFLNIQSVSLLILDRTVTFNSAGRFTWL